MNTSEWEQQLKALLDDKEYVPQDREWERMRQALRPAAPGKAVWYLPAAWKAAAAVVLLGTGIAGYFRVQQKEQPLAPPVAGTQVSPTAGTRPEAYASARPGTSAWQTPVTHMANKRKGTTRPQPDETSLPAPVQDTAGTGLITASAPVQESGGKQEKPAAAATQASPVNARQLWPDTYAPAAKGPQKTDFGFTAQIGKPSQGNMQYNVGVLIRRELTKVLYAEAGLALAATQVNYSEQVMIPPPVDNLGSGVGFESARPVDAHYTGNMFAIGISPSIGMKATRNFSVAVGGDLYKSLNRALQPEAPAGQMGGYTLENAPIPSRGIAEWDAGIRGQIEYRIGERLSLHTQYRQGLSRYILVDGSAYRNSNFNVGMKFYLGR